MHIAVVGLGPAGAFLALRASRRGWTVDAYDPACVAGGDHGEAVSLPRWRNTYAITLDSLPLWAQDLIPLSASSDELRAHTPEPRSLGYGRYGVIDCPALQDRIAESLTGVTLHRRRVDRLTARDLGVDAVVDCRGIADRPGSIRQVAYGVFLPHREIDVTGGSAEFMDWRPSPTASQSSCVDSSFLYVVDTGDSVLVEETVLATRTSTRVLLPELQARLRGRIGGAMDRAVGRETVHFVTDRRSRPWYRGPDADGVSTFGAAGGLIHPATGYSLAAAVAAVDDALDLLEGARVHGRIAAASAWRLRVLGAELIVAARDPGVLPRFFDAFFRLPVRLQRRYLEGQGAVGVAAAMLALAVFPGKVLPFLRPLPRCLVRAGDPRR